MNKNYGLSRLERHIGGKRNRIGKNGRLIVRATKKDDRTHLVPLYRRIPYQWQGFHYQDVDDQPFLQLHHSAGGLTNGDTAAVYFSSEPETRSLVTTTEATRYYKTTTEEPAHEVFEFDVDSGSVLEYLPDETIPYADSKTKRETFFNLKADSHLIATDILSGGRLEYLQGEMFDFDTFQSKSVVSVEGKSIFVDNLLLDKSNSNRVLDSWLGFRVLSTVVAFSSHLEPGIVDDISASLEAIPNIKFGVSFDNFLLVVKVLTHETWLAHEVVHDVWSTVRPNVLFKPSLSITKG